MLIFEIQRERIGSLQPAAPTPTYTTPRNTCTSNDKGWAYSTTTSTISSTMSSVAQFHNSNGFFFLLFSLHIFLLFYFLCALIDTTNDACRCAALFLSKHFLSPVVLHSLLYRNRREQRLTAKLVTGVGANKSIVCCAIHPLRYGPGSTFSISANRVKLLNCIFLFMRDDHLCIFAASLVSDSAKDRPRCYGEGGYAKGGRARLTAPLHHPLWRTCPESPWHCPLGGAFPPAKEASSVVFLHLGGARLNQVYCARDPDQLLLYPLAFVVPRCNAFHSHLDQPICCLIVHCLTSLTHYSSRLILIN
eukprot:gene6095-4385_t